MSGNSKSFYLVTLGCSKNQVDSEALEVDLTGSGMTKAGEIEDADLVLLNSCGFISDAKIETIDTVFDLHRRRKKDSIFVLCGCLPARYNLQESLDEVDILLPSNEHHRLIPMLKDSGWLLENADFPIKRMKPTVPYGYLKISEGCDNRCSYCSIPYIKGAYASRPPEQLEAEARYLCGQGVKELILIGQDTTLYGSDFSKETDLRSLIDRLATIDGCEWIRLMYAHPAHLNDELIEIFMSLQKVVKYIDLPLQHINDRILGLMNRRVDRKRISALIDRLRSAIPGISIRTTFMVGFPGETDREFAELLDFCEEIRFDHVGIFKYSVEDGTVAERLKGRIDNRTMEERFLTLLDLQNKISGELLRKRVGMTEKALLEEIDARGTGYGRAWFQAPEVDGRVIINGCNGIVGEFMDVRFENSDAYDLFAAEA